MLKIIWYNIKQGESPIDTARTSSDQTMYKLITSKLLKVNPKSTNNIEFIPIIAREQYLKNSSTDAVEPATYQFPSLNSVGYHSKAIEPFNKSDFPLIAYNHAPTPNAEATLSEDFGKIKARIESTIEEKQAIEKEIYELHMENLKLQNINEGRNSRFSLDCLSNELETYKSQILELKNEKAVIAKQIEVENKRMHDEEQVHSILAVKS